MANDPTTRGGAFLATLDHEPDPFEQAVADYLDARLGGTTPQSGLPYPASTDPVAQGAAAIQALATALDPQVFGAYRSAYNSSSQAITTGVWTLLTCSTVGDVAGTGISASGKGFAVAASAVYQVDGFVQWPASQGSTIGVGPLEGSSPTTFYRQGGTAFAVSGSWSFRIAAGGTVGLWVNHAEGTTKNVINSRLAASRVTVG